MMATSVYYRVGELVEALVHGRGSVKSLLYPVGDVGSNCGGALKKNKNNENVAQVYALLVSTMKYRSALVNIINASNILKENRFLRDKQHVIEVMVYDLLFGDGLMRGTSGRVARTILKYQGALRAQLAREKIRRRATSNAELIPAHMRTVLLPRFVRVNLLSTTVQAVKSHFVDNENYKEVDNLEVLLSASPHDQIFCQDQDFEELLVFPMGTHFHDDSMYNQGHIILQDKASFMSGRALRVPPNAHALDACAAPGMKTSVLCADMKNKGTLLATEKDANRCSLLKRLAKKHHLKNLKVLNQDFTTLDPKQIPFSTVEYILVDPSCSGSGIVNRLDYVLSDAQENEVGFEIDAGNEGEEKDHDYDDDAEVREIKELKSAKEKYISDSAKKRRRKKKLSKWKKWKMENRTSNTSSTSRAKPGIEVGGKEDREERRLAKLSEFQFAIVSHALSFPSVKRVVYSTCSVHREENEDVVERLVGAHGSVFELVKVFPSWRHRGIPSEKFKEATRCVRSSPDTGHTIGFFIAAFERRSTSSSHGVSGVDVVLSTTMTSPKSLAKKKKKKKHRKRKRNVSEIESRGRGVENIVVGDVTDETEPYTVKRCKINDER